jgi:hypothetical protein
VTGQLATDPQTTFYAACAVLLLAVGVLAVVVKPVLAMWALAVLFVADMATPVPLDTSLLRVGASNIYPVDVLSVVMLIATAILFIRRPPPARIMLPLTAAGAIFVVNLYNGIKQFGLDHATNESREWLYFFATTAFVVAAGPWTSRFWRPWFALALGLAGLTWLGLGRYGLHPVTSQITVNGQQVDPRPLTAAGALAIAFALIAMLGSHHITSRRKIVLGAAALGTIVLLQQRTVWVVLAVVLLVWAAASVRRYSTARHRRLATAGVTVLGAAAVALASGVATGSVLSRSIAEPMSQNSTFRWRLIGWSDLLHSDHSPAALAFGQPFGTGYGRSVFGTVVDVVPHSFYVAALLRIGLIGLLAVAFLYWNAWTHRHQAAAALGVSPLTVGLLLVALLVFSFTYEPSLFASSLAAGLLTWEAQHRPQPVAEAAAGRAIPILQETP